ncbi:MAG: hypothetical protein WBN65_03410 [Gammaproteobacteria bacterium]
MIDRPWQMLLALALIGLMALLLRRSAPRRRRSAAGPASRVAWLVLRVLLGFLLLLGVLVALEATRFVDADICLDFSAGVEWCNYTPDTVETL